MCSSDLFPSHDMLRVVEGMYDIMADGINPSLGVFNFSLNDLPGYTDFTALFDQYKIDRIEIEWCPEYTELTDAITNTSINLFI